MTANQMADELDLRLDRVSSYGGPGYEDFDYSSVLTEAQWSYIKRFISQENNRKREGFEETEIRSQGLSALVQSTLGTVSSNQSGVLKNGVLFDLPSDFMITIFESIEIDKKDCNNNVIEGNIRVVTHNEVNRFKNNKYKKPFYKTFGDALVWRLSYSREIDGSDPNNSASSKRHQLVTDGTFNVSKYVLNYLKVPTEIIVDRNIVSNQKNCILDESTHTTIIDIAKDIMLERVKEQKLQNIEALKDLE